MADDEVGLPKATLHKIVKEAYPDLKLSSEAMELLMACCVEFVTLLGSQSNEECTKDKKKILMGDHVVKALKSLGFDRLAESAEVHHVQLQEDDKEVKAARKTKKGMQGVPGLSHEELVALQQKMLSEAAARSFQLPDLPGGGDAGAAAGAGDDEDE